MTIPLQLTAVIVKYGYVATFLGTLVEGETVLALSGVAANRGYLEAPILVLIGAAAAMLTDNAFFQIGRHLGPRFFSRFPRLRLSIERAQGLLVRVPITAVLAMRFLYGTRIVGPALLGTGDIAWPKFLLLDALAAGLWSGCWVSVGYLLAEVIERSIQDVVGVGRWVVAVAVVVAVGIVVLKARGRKNARIASRE
jgi:membrane protein DedA with SNARE-associated domain